MRRPPAAACASLRANAAAALAVWRPCQKASFKEVLCPPGSERIFLRGMGLSSVFGFVNGDCHSVHCQLSPNDLKKRMAFIFRTLGLNHDRPV